MASSMIEQFSHSYRNVEDNEDDGGGEEKENVGGWWARMPCVTRMFLLVLPLSCTIGFAPRIRFWIVSSPYLTIYCLGLWRIFTNVFSEPGPIDALLAAWWISVYWSDMECTKGSVRLLHCFAFVYLGGGTCSLAICMMLGVWPVDEDNPHPLYNDNVKSFFVNQLHEGLWAPILG